MGQPQNEEMVQEKDENEDGLVMLREVSSNLSFPDIDKINKEQQSDSNSNDEEEPIQSLNIENYQYAINTKLVSTHSNRSTQSVRTHKNNKLKHIRSSTFGSHDSPIPTLNDSKMIKLFYRFQNKSYPPLMAKTTNTVNQLKSTMVSSIQSSLKNINVDNVEILHRGKVLKNMNLTLSQCDIDQYDTIILQKKSNHTLNLNELEEDLSMEHKLKINLPKSANRITDNKVIGIIGQFTPYKTSHSTSSLNVSTAFLTPRSMHSNAVQYDLCSPPIDKKEGIEPMELYNISRPVSVRGYDDSSICRRPFSFK